MANEKNKKTIEDNEENLNLEEQESNSSEETVQNSEVSEDEKELLTLAKEKAEAEANLQKDNYLRLAAEYDNYRRRTAKEKKEIEAQVLERVMKQWLPVLDDVERALSATESLKGEEANTFREGLLMIEKSAKNALLKLGVKEIEATGKTFDPECHEAVMHIEDDTFGENEIVEVFQKGYCFGEKVLRHSVVKVAN